MKRIFIIIGIMMIALQVDAKQLIPIGQLINPGFENGCNQWNTKFRNSYIASNIFHNGQLSVFNQFTGAHHYAEISQYINIIPGQINTFSGWVFPAVHQSTSMSTGVFIKYFDSIGNQVGNSNGQTLNNALTGWQQLTVTNTPPASAIKAEVGFFVYSQTNHAGDKIYFDDAWIN